MSAWRRTVNADDSSNAAKVVLVPTHEKRGRWPLSGADVDVRRQGPGRPF
jgi:hypothetical protein